MTREAAVKALSDCRERIDAIDRRLLALLNERTRIVEQIGRIKQECKMPVYEPKREEEVLGNIDEHNGGPWRLRRRGGSSNASLTRCARCSG